MFILPDLPYPADALEPVISARTLGFHHGKHHKAYVDTLNSLLADAGKAPDSLETVIREAADAPGSRKLFNNAAQAWNHAFFWDSMAADPSPPTGALETAIKAAFGDLATLRETFVAEGVGHFASGWVWLVSEGGALKVISTHDADDTVPLDGVTPLLVCDLWEHAYYLDHQNNRKGFLEAWFDRLANWGLADRQLAASRGDGQGWSYPLPRNA
jgi:Fe-Mn family superoxide dismutase